MEWLELAALLRRFEERPGDAEERIGSGVNTLGRVLLGVGRVIEGLAIREGTKNQYPLYDALAMGVQMMVFTYLLGRTDSLGRSLVEVWADSRAKSRLGSSLLSIAAIVVIGHAVYLSVFVPHLVTKVLHMQTGGPSEQLFEGVPNQPL